MERKIVKPKFWWRRGEASIPSNFISSNNQKDEHSRKQRFLSHMEGKCFRCLSTSHKVIDCRDPLRCWFCLGFGHLSSSCRKRRYKLQDQQQVPPTTSDFPPLSANTSTTKNTSSSFPSAPAPQEVRAAPSSMAGVPSDLVSRPDSGHAMVAATAESECLRALFAARSVVAWTTEGERVDLNTFADDVRAAHRIHRSDIQVTKFHPEDFFLTFTNHGDREAVLQQPRLVTRSGREYFFRPWDDRRGAEVANVRFRVRICIEGIPMHGRSVEAVTKLIDPKSSVHYVEEYSRRRNYNKTFDAWVWTLDPSSIPKAESLTILRPDAESPPVDTPFPDLEPQQPVPREDKKGLTYPIIIHVDSVQDLVARVCRGYQWRYGVPDDATRARMIFAPFDPCRTLPAPEHRSDDEDDHRDQRSRQRHRSRSLWGRLGGRSSSRSREPDRGDRGGFNEENRGRQRERADSMSRSRSRNLSHSQEPGETRLQRQAAAPDQQGPPSSQTASKDPGTVLELLEKHLDPMVHEAEMAHSLYSPDTSLPRPVSPVFVLSTAGNAAIAKPEWKGEKLVDVFLEELITPMQQPLLLAPGDKTRRPCRNKHYKKPLSPAAVKTIAALVEKGGCKSIRLGGAKKKSTVVPALRSLKLQRRPRQCSCTVEDAGL
ncbi:uncharacterized protein LOC127784913 isoform X2 [Oryza glaberrima]|uniref:uncharacterized protein LOC127784913 isoform X2 n=1 Tax=Oryza glaberrima TaxID=4538 RepID=UPI00224C0FF4|nr:uncharacterized protein LOC127784913 isoform X2 [Oryza glaberrima]